VKVTHLLFIRNYRNKFGGGKSLCLWKIIFDTTLVTRALIGILLNIINSINIFYLLISLSVHRTSPDVEFLCTPLKVSI
jgi:hypothetical protein